MWPQLINMLSWWQWLILAAVPPAIVLLYFLKLKRVPLEVPSTYLWHKSIEDLHVNAIWQRLRNNLLLWLQLLLILLVALALLRPGWKGTQLVGKRFIFLIDRSASMQATDGGKSRLQRAKDQVRGLIQNHMQSGDAAMLVSFADSARVEQPFTDNRARLVDALDGIQPTQRTTSLADAFKVASGLANPGRTSEDATDFQVAEALPATLYIFSDGRFPDLENVSLGNLTEKFVQMADPEAENVAISAFSVRREENSGHLQAFARLQYFAPKESPRRTVSVELLHDGELIDAAELAIEPGGADSAVFPLGTVDDGVLHLKARTGDDLALDDEAWVVVRPPQRARVLLLTPGNEPLETAFSTQAAGELADIEVQPPVFLEDKAYRGNAAAGLYDLVIYDRCSPEAMPQANTFFIGRLPPGEVWKAKPLTGAPAIIDTDPAHPLMQWLSLSDVIVAEATPLELPPGARVLIDTDAGPVLAVAPREGYEDLVLGLALVDEAEGGGRTVGTNWIIRPSFPSFALNVLEYLGRGGDVQTGDVVQPGQPVTLKAPAAERSVQVVAPGGRAVRLSPIKPGEFSFTDTEKLGVYDARFASDPHRPFVVNLFDPDESDIRGRNFRIGHVDVVAETKWEGVRKESWKYLVLAGVGLLLAEWYLYGRRVRM